MKIESIELLQDVAMKMPVRMHRQTVDWLCVTYEAESFRI